MALSEGPRLLSHSKSKWRDSGCCILIITSSKFQHWTRKNPGQWWWVCINWCNSLFFSFLFFFLVFNIYPKHSFVSKSGNQNSKFRRKGMESGASEPHQIITRVSSWLMMRIRSRERRLRFWESRWVGSLSF